MVNDKPDGGDLVDLNSASVEELSHLPGVGPALAERVAAGRPYLHVDELRRVSGLGAATLEGLQNRVCVTAPSVPRTAGGAEAPHSVDRHPAQNFSRRQVAWLVGTSVILSVLLSMGLTLAVMSGINGTLDIGRSAAVQNLRSQTDQLANQAQALQGRLDAIDNRVQSLQGLTGRMSQVETQTSRLEDDVALARAAAEGLSQQVDGLAATTEDLGLRQSRLEAVFQGLADLLAPWASPSNPTDTPPPTATPSGQD